MSSSFSFANSFFCFSSISEVATSSICSFVSGAALVFTRSPCRRMSGGESAFRWMSEMFFATINFRRLFTSIMVSFLDDTDALQGQPILGQRRDDCAPRYPKLSGVRCQASPNVILRQKHTPPFRGGGCGFRRLRGRVLQ